MNEERLTALSLAIETGTDMHFDKEELEWLIAAACERNELARHKDKSDRVARGLLQDTYKLEKEALTLRANNAALREALEACLYAMDNSYGGAENYAPLQKAAARGALASTLADSLTEYRDGVLEAIEPQLITIEAHGTVLQDEGEFEEYKDRQILGMCLHDAVNAIRAMKAET